MKNKIKIICLCSAALTFLIKGNLSHISGAITLILLIILLQDIVKKCIEELIQLFKEMVK